jgi:hypothetical protein
VGDLFMLARHLHGRKQRERGYCPLFDPAPPSSKPRIRTLRFVPGFAVNK